MPPTRRLSTQQGFSLVEVLLAGALLGTVLLTIAGLFMHAMKGVRSGRELTRATALADGAVEELMAWPVEQVWGITGAPDTVATSTWTSGTPIPTYDAASADVDTWTEALERWTTQVEEELPEGEIAIRVDGLRRLPNPGEGVTGREAYVEAQYIRVTFTVRWDEAGRARHVVFEHVLM